MTSYRQIFQGQGLLEPLGAAIVASPGGASPKPNGHDRVASANLTTCPMRPVKATSSIMGQVHCLAPNSVEDDYAILNLRTATWDDALEVPIK